jgi:hypothetical protein
LLPAAEALLAAAGALLAAGGASLLLAGEPLLPASPDLPPVLELVLDAAFALVAGLLADAGVFCGDAD